MKLGYPSKPINKHPKKIGYETLQSGAEKRTVFDYNGEMREEWRLNGKLHREDGPALIDGLTGQEVYYLVNIRVRDRTELMRLLSLPEEEKSFNVLVTGNPYGL